MNPLKHGVKQVSSTKLSKRQSGWAAAIRDAEKNIEKLRTVISICKEKMERGEPWPGSVKAATHS
jgi:hypothetical protein